MNATRTTAKAGRTSKAKPAKAHSEPSTVTASNDVQVITAAPDTNGGTGPIVNPPSDHNVNHIVAPVVMWQTLTEIVRIHTEDTIAAVKMLKAAGPTNADRLAVVLRFPHWEAKTVKPSKRKKGKATEVDGMTTYFDTVTPNGQEYQRRLTVLNSFGKKKTEEHKTEIAAINKDRMYSVKVMKQVRRIADMCQRLDTNGFAYQFVYDKLAHKPCMVCHRPSDDTPAIWAQLYINDFVALYPEGAKGGTTAQLIEAAAPADKGADEARNDKKGHFTKLAEVTDALAGIEGYLGDDGRIKLVRGVGVKHPAYAHMRAVYAQIGSVLLGYVADKGAFADLLKTVDAALPAPAAVNGEKEPSTVTAQKDAA